MADQNAFLDKLNILKLSVEGLHKDIDDLIGKNGYSSDMNFVEIFGWNAAPLTFNMILESIDFLHDQILEIIKLGKTEESDLFNSQIDQYIKAIEVFRKTSLGHLLSSNSQIITSNLISLIDAISYVLTPKLNWSGIQDRGLLPQKIHRRLKNFQAQIDEMEPLTGSLKEKIELINSAHSTAENLPMEMQDIIDLRKELQLAKEATLKEKLQAEQFGDQIKNIHTRLQASEHQADLTIQKAEEAYRTSTSKGLAQAFTDKAKSLNFSIIFWGIGLFIALGTIALLSYLKVAKFNELLTSTTINWGAVSLNIIFSILSVAAPLWFSWLATKQINKRFTLAEDYAYKASVAMAYEGYRREAERFDASLQAKLFDAAVSRLEEHPLRLLSDKDHSSPLNELLQTGLGKNISDIIPDAKDRVGKIIDHAIDATNIKSD